MATRRNNAENVRRWRSKPGNREKWNEYQREWRKRNPSKQAAASRRYREKCKNGPFETQCGYYPSICSRQGGHSGKMCLMSGRCGHKRKVRVVE